MKKFWDECSERRGRRESTETFNTRCRQIISGAHGHLKDTCNLYERERKKIGLPQIDRERSKRRGHISPLFSGVLLCTISKLAWLLACFDSHTADKYPGNCLAKFQGGKSKGICLSRAGQKKYHARGRKKISANNGRWRNRNINCMHTRLGKV